jgi:hypothetical protein
MQENTMKKCNVCKKTKELTEFHKNKKQPDGALVRCKECSSRLNREYHEANKEKRRFDRLRTKYGVEREHYELMYDRCGGKCELCGVDEENIPNKQLCVDHNHETDEVRGLLCLNCNAGLGGLGDSVERLEAAIIYLKERGSYG